MDLQARKVEMTRQMAEKIGTRIPCNVVPKRPTPKNEPTLPAEQQNPSAPPLENYNNEKTNDLDTYFKCRQPQQAL